MKPKIFNFYNLKFSYINFNNPVTLYFPYSKDWITKIYPHHNFNFKLKHYSKSYYKNLNITKPFNSLTCLNITLFKIELCITYKSN